MHSNGRGQSQVPSRYGAKALSRKLLRGIYGSYTIYFYMSARQINIYLFQVTWYHPCGTLYCDKLFLLMHALQINSTYITTLVFPRETDNTRRNRQNIYFDESERR